jgi:hypothetical protein
MRSQKFPKKLRHSTIYTTPSREYVDMTSLTRLTYQLPAAIRSRRTSRAPSSNRTRNLRPELVLLGRYHH